MTDRTPPNPEPAPSAGQSAPQPVPQPAQPTPVVPSAGQPGGIYIDTGGGQLNVGHSIVDGSQTIYESSPGAGGDGKAGGSAGKAGPSAGELFVKSSWANGLFYLFSFLAIIGVVGWISQMVDIVTLALIVVAGIIAVPVLGALQLKMDKRLTDKSFLALMKMSLAQLPVIGGLVKK